MAELGFGAGGVSDALQLVQALQTGKIDQQQKQVALESSQLQLENLKKLQASLGSQSFSTAMSGADPAAQNKALMQLASTYLASNMPQQAHAVASMAVSSTRAQAYATEQQAQAAHRYITMAEDLFSGVSNAQEWGAAQQFMQSQLPPEALQNPVLKGLLTSGYSPDKVRIMPQFLERLKQRAQATVDFARANEADARTDYYSFEEKRDLAQADVDEARADYYRSHGANALSPSKQEIQDVANDLQSKYPEAEAEPVVVGGKITDPTAVRGNYKARVQARATDIAEAAKSYVKSGMKPAEARRRAIEEADQRGDLSSLKPLPGAPSGTTTRPGVTVTDQSASSAGWGEPTQVGK